MPYGLQQYANMERCVFASTVKLHIHFRPSPTIQLINHTHDNALSRPPHTTQPCAGGVRFCVRNHRTIGQAVEGTSQSRLQDTIQQHLRRTNGTYALRSNQTCAPFCQLLYIINAAFEWMQGQLKQKNGQLLLVTFVNGTTIQARWKCFVLIEVGVSYRADDYEFRNAANNMVICLDDLFSQLSNYQPLKSI